jgi:DNA repair protein RadA/Sms
MTRTFVRYECSACGNSLPKWVGRCPECDEWGTVAEAAAASASPAVQPLSRPQPIAEVDPVGATRIETGVPELDRVLSGGLVAGSVSLIGGEPGMGKSTLLLQALGRMAERGVRSLLVSAEESLAQVRLRADRLGTLAPELFVVADTSLPTIAAHVEALAPSVCVVDSIQTVHDPDAPGAAGSVAQVRDGAQALVRIAKERGTAMLLVGHVTKDGTLAGPRALEHIVDTVLSFEGDRHHALRMLRALKHRFGATDELGLMEMTARGLIAVEDPSALFLADRRPGASGSVIASVMEGSRPLCVEVQSLVTESCSPIPRRVAPSIDGTRLAMLSAILVRRANIALKNFDVYASVAGDVRVDEPGADLAIALAVAGARYDEFVDADTVVIGEIGLGGEVRQVPHAPRRLSEAMRCGFTRAIVPMSTPDVRGMQLVRVSDIREALAATPIGAG